MDSPTEPKMRELLSSIKWASVHCNKPIQIHSISYGNPQPPCVARGVGLTAGIVKGRCKFSLTTATNLNPIHLRIHIKGPENEHCEEIITDICESSKVNVLKKRTNRLERLKYMIYSMLRWQSQRVESHDISNASLTDGMRMSFEYQCVAPGYFIVSYIPVKEGIHSIFIYWDHLAIAETPFKS